LFCHAAAVSYAEEERPVTSRNIYIVIGVVVVLVILGYLLGWFGGAEAPTTTAPAPAPAPGAPATGTTTQ
jgi:hypothetical protein